MKFNQVREVVFYGDSFFIFYKKLSPQAKLKVDWTLQLIESLPLVPEKFLKHLSGTDGLYEIRIAYESNAYRLLCFFDEGKLMVVLNGFHKKTNRTPNSEINSKTAVLAAKNSKTAVLAATIMEKNKITSLREHLDQEYGVAETASRASYEEGFEAFQLGYFLQELRAREGWTQEELAKRCGTTKSYISRIENNASDIRLSTILRIFREGFGKQVHFVIT
jgi:phage-related protein/DNA-binding XRE family transcriptional regulator